MRSFFAVLNFSKRAFAAAVLAIGLLAASGPVSRGASVVGIEPIANPSGVRISVQPPASGGWGLIQIVDPATGEVLRTVHAGRVRPSDSHVVVASEKLPAGSYK